MPRSLGGNRPTQTPIVVQAPVANTTVGRYRFGRGTSMTDPGVTARPCYVINETGQLIYVRVNAWDAVGAWDTCNATTFDIKIADGAQYDISELGTIAVSTVAVWVATSGDVAQLYIRGFIGR